MVKLDDHLRDGAGRGRWDVHRRFVRLKHKENLPNENLVSRLDKDVGDRDIGELTDIRNQDLHQSVSDSTVQSRRD